VLDVDRGEVAAVKLKLPGGYAWADWHPEGRLLAVAGWKDRTIYLWDVAAGRLALPPLDGHKNSGVVMRFNHAGDRLLSTDWSASWHLWDTRTGQLLLTLPAGGPALCFGADDRFVGTTVGQGKVQTYRFQRGEELRTVLHPGSNKQRRDYTTAGFPWVAPDNRLLAIGTEDGVALVDLARGEEAALLPLPMNVPLCFDPEGALWTIGPAGNLRWPVAADPKTGRRRYGPPQRTIVPVSGQIHGTSPDVRIVAIRDQGGRVNVFRRDSKRLLRLDPQDDVRSCAVSPDGLWVASGSHNLRAGTGAKVWDARDGRPIKDLPVGAFCGVQFSPDGKWLLTTGGGCRLWEVGSWKEGPSLAASPLNRSAAFSCDGKLLALGDAPGVVRLVVTDTGAEIARLTAPEQARLLPCCFTPDGTQLLALGHETWVLHVFDLRAIRAGLAELDLDWKAPPLPARSTAPAPPLSIQFDLGDIAKPAGVPRVNKKKE
jgi:WD40 repeat protein